MVTVLETLGLVACGSVLVFSIYGLVLSLKMDSGESRRLRREIGGNFFKRFGRVWSGTIPAEGPSYVEGMAADDKGDNGNMRLEKRSQLSDLALSNVFKS